ncbi:MAG: response regulator [Verrucomicrobiota bacterium]
MNTAIEILLVEDNPDDLELALFALKKNNFANTIQVARDGEEALDFLFCRGVHSTRSFETPPRVVLLDLKLPKIDGLEVLRAIKNDHRTKSVPIVVMTSSKQQRDMIEGYQLGVNSYIQKPIDFAEFREIIKQLGYYWLVINQPPPAEAFK